MRALRQRVSVKIGAAVATLIALVAFGQWIVFRTTMELSGRELRAQLVEPGMALALAVARGGPDEARLRDDVGAIDGFCIAFYDAEGRRIARSRDDVPEARERLPSESLARADAAGGHAVMLSESATFDAPTGAIAAVPGEGDVAYVGLYERAAAATIFAVRLRVLFGITTLLAVVALVVSALLAARIRQGIQSTQRVVQRIADGALAERLPAGGDDEVGALVADFNRMADRIEDLVTQLRGEQEQKRRLFAAFTHEINTPLTSVLGYLESLRMDDVDRDPETRRRYVEVAHEQAKALDALADDLETLSRMELEGLPLDRATHDLAAIARREADALGPRAAQAGVAIEVAAVPVLADVDPRRIGQVLRNALDNAIRHARGTPVAIAVRREEGAPVIEIRDRGEGIAPEDLLHLGEPLFRADRSRTRGTGGRGLGLAIARGIVEAHGGRMTIDSRLGEGTTVRIDLARDDVRRDEA